MLQSNVKYKVEDRSNFCGLLRISELYQDSIMVNSSLERENVQKKKNMGQKHFFLLMQVL